MSITDEQRARHGLSAEHVETLTKYREEFIKDMTARVQSTFGAVTPTMRALIGVMADQNAALQQSILAVMAEKDAETVDAICPHHCVQCCAWCQPEGE